MSERTIGGRYRLGDPLGLGGMASVWEADDLELGRRVAVKLLAPDGDRVRFDREARAAATLAHPNVVRVYDVGESDEGPYMVMELLGGGTLEDRLEAGEPLPDAETERVAAGIAAGLAHAHGHGLVHRDLKPANVFFDVDGRPKIGDFGIARLDDRSTLTEAGTVLGTAATIAPEQAVGEPATPASDVYSFGVLLFLMLTGRLPFHADDPLELAAMHVREEPPPVVELRPDAPPRLESLAAAALTKDPAGRPSDGAALLRELGITPLGVAATAGATSAAERPERHERRRLPAALAAAGVLLLAAAGAGVAVLASGRDEAPASATASSEPPARAATTTATASQEVETVERTQTAAETETTAEQEPAAPPPTTAPAPPPTTGQETTEPLPTEPPVTVGPPPEPPVTTQPGAEPPAPGG